MDSGSPPDIAHLWYQGDVFRLIRLVTADRASWEISLGNDGMWTARQVNPLDSRWPLDVGYFLPTHPAWDRNDIIGLWGLLRAYRSSWKIFVVRDGQPGRTMGKAGIWVTQEANLVDSGSLPDITYSLPMRPAWHKGDVFNLIRLVTAYRASWEISLSKDAIWIAQGVTDSNKWARFEAETAEHLERLIKSV